MFNFFYITLANKLYTLNQIARKKKKKVLTLVHQQLAIAMELEITELRLGLPGRDGCDSGLNSSSNNNKNEKKRAFSDICDEANYETNGERKINPTKSQVVGWPPVCSYRRKNSFNEKDGGESSKMYVKVSMDGAPFLRKIDLGMHQGYPDLAMSLEKLFGCFGLSKYSRYSSFFFFNI